jgi:hypothetical protein
MPQSSRFAPTHRHRFDPELPWHSVRGERPTAWHADDDVDYFLRGSHAASAPLARPATACAWAQAGAGAAARLLHAGTTTQAMEEKASREDAPFKR